MGRERKESERERNPISDTGKQERGGKREKKI